MFAFNFVGWLKSLTRRRIKPFQKKPPRRLCIEVLEHRLAPASFTWTGANHATDTNWSDKLNWIDSTGHNTAPTAGAPVQLTFQSAGTSSFTSNDDISGLVVNQLTIASGTFTISGSQTLTLGDPTANTAALLIKAGALGETMSMPIQMGTAVQSSETITIQSAASLTLSGNLSGNSATQLTQENVGTLTLSGNNSNFLGSFTVDNTFGNATAIVTNQNALGSPITSALQSLSISGASLGHTVVTLKYPDGVTNPSTTFTYQGSAADATNIATQLNALVATSAFNGGAGYTGNPITVTQTSTGFGTAETFAISFGGSMAGINLLQLSASAPGATASTAVLAIGGAPNFTTVNPNTLLEVNVPSGGTIANPMNISDAGTDAYSGVLQRTVAGTVTLSGNIVMHTNSTIGDNAGSTIQITGLISESNTSPGFGLTKEGQGTLVLNPQTAISASNNFQGGNTYHGNTYINNGVVSIDHPYAFGAGGGTTDVTVGNRSGESGSLQIDYTGNPTIPTADLNYNIVQTVSLAGATAGTTKFSLTFNGVTTAPITFNNVAGPDTTVGTDAYNVMTALNGLATVNGIGASVAVTMSGTASSPVFSVTFFGTLGGIEIPEISGAISSAFGTGSISEGVSTGTTPIGFQIPDQYLVLPTSLTNVAGTNSWEQPTADTAPLAISLSGTVNLTVAQDNLTIDGTMGGGGFTKTGHGRLILPHPNSVTSVAVQQGELNLRDSNGIGGVSPTVSGNTTETITAASWTGGIVTITTPFANGFGVGATVFVGGMTPDAYDGFYTIQSSTVTTFTYALATNPGTATGLGTATIGATLELQADGYPDSSAQAGTYNLYFPSTVTFNIGSGAGSYGAGLIYNMSGANKIEGKVISSGAFTLGVAPDPDPYNIQAATWNDLSQLTIDGVISGGVMTKIGYGEMVLTAANTFGTGTGQNTYETIIDQGWITVENAQALGTIYQNIDPADQPGVLVADVPDSPLNLGAALVLKQDLGGDNLNLPYAIGLTGTGITNRFPWLNQMGALVNLDGSNTVSGDVWLNGPAGIGVEVDGAVNPFANPSQLLLTGTIHDGTSPGELVKLGTERLILQGPGVYTGGVDIQDGVILIQNDSALGLGSASASVTTTVETGAALELGSTIAAQTGGTARGLEVWYNNLVLNGPGDAEFGDAPLMVLANDNAWQGPMTLNAAITVQFHGTAANVTLPAMITTVNSSNGTVTAVTSTVGAADIDDLQTLKFGGTFATGDTFTLVVANANGTQAQTAPIAWSANVNQLIANIQAALDTPSIENLFGATVSIAQVALLNPVIDLYPNTRLTVTGVVADGTIAADISIQGGGELNLTGTNTYHGTTTVSQGILTIENATALGSAPTGQVQTITLPGASATNTTFLLSFNGYTTPTAITYSGNATTDAANIAAALNALSSVSGVNGSVTVTENVTAPASPVITITFGGALDGFEQPLVTASITAGPAVTPANFIQTSGQGGTIVANGSQIQIQGGIDVTGKPIVLQGSGNPLESEIQSFTVGGPTQGTFQLTFTNPFSTPTSTYTTLPLPIGASAAQVQAALNSLPSIQAGVGAGSGTVSVTENALDTYTVLFSGSFTGAGQPWSQQNLTLDGTVGQTLTLNFTGYTPTATVTIGATPAATQAALQSALTALLTNPSSPGSLSGTATVAYNANTGAYGITFGGSLAQGSVPTLVVTPGLAQAITVSGTSGQTFTLQFTGHTNTAAVTIGATSAATASSIQTALGTLLALVNAPGGGTGTASVAVVNGQYVVTFAGSLAGLSVPLLVPVNVAASATVRRLANATVAHPTWLSVATSSQVLTTTATTGSFALGFTGYGPTVTESSGVSAAQLQTDLNTLLAESQQLTVVGASGKTFTLNFTGYTTTATVTIGATAALTLSNILTALNSTLLTPVGFLPGGSPGNGTGSATGSIDPVTGAYYISFGGSLAGVAVPLLIAAPVTATSATASYSAPGDGGATAAATSWWQQAITIVGTTGQTFALHFTGYTPTASVTVQSTPQATAIALQQALNYLLSNPTGGSPGSGTGTATVVYDAAGLDYVVNFGGSLTNASVPLLVGTTGTASATVASQSEPFQIVYSGNLAGTVAPLVNPSAQQSLAVTGVAGQQFALNFTGYTSTATFAVGASASATQSNIQTALNSLLAYAGAAPGGSPGAGTGTASVSIDSATGNFIVSYGADLTGVSVPLLIASPVQQQISVSGSNGTFTLKFTGFATTITENFNVTAATLTTDLTSLVHSVLSATGTATVTLDASTGNFDVVFGGSQAGLAVPLLVGTTATGNASAVNVTYSVNVAAVTTAVLAYTGNDGLSGEVLLGGTSNATPTSWFSSGPGPVANAAVNLESTTNLASVAGPVTSIVADPSDTQIIYIATANGGAWKTDNGGTTWTPLFDSLSTVQSYTVTGVDPTVDTYALTYTSPTTGLQTSTASIPYNASASQIAAALNAVVGEGNSVSVQQTINASGQDEQEQLTLNTTASESTWTTQSADSQHYTRFTLSYGTGRNNTTGEIPYTGVATTDAGAIQTALNGLQTLTSIGASVSVSVAPTIPATQGVSTDESFLITFGGSLADSNNAKLIGFQIGGGGGGQFWQGNNPPSPFPTINLTTATHQGRGATPIDFDSGSLPIVQPGQGPTTTNTVTFGGGGLATESVAPLMFNTAGSTTIGMGVSSLTLTSGSGYTQPTAVFTNLTGATAPTSVAAATVYGAVTKVAVGSGGTGYQSVPAVVFTGGSGSGASAVATVVGGVVTGITILNGGNGYVTAPTVTLLGGNPTTAATATATLGVTGVTVTNAGGYTTAPNVTIYDASGTGTGAAAFATLNSTGGVGTVTVTAGSGYNANPAVTFTGTGVNAAATTTVLGAVSGFTITNPGIDYLNNPTVSIVGGGGSGATAAAIVNPTAGAAGQLGQVSQLYLTSGYTGPISVSFSGGFGATAGTSAIASVTGSVTAINVINGGSGWSAAPTVTIQDATGGIGSGASAIAYINSSGVVTSVVVTNAGSNYTGPISVSFTAPMGVTFTTAGSASATMSVTKVTVNSGGAGYVAPPTVTFKDMGGSGTSATGYASISAGGAVTGVTITTGSNYTSDPSVWITGGSGNYALATASISAAVTGIYLTNSGTGYSAPPTVTIAAGTTTPVAFAAIQTDVVEQGTSTNINTAGGSIAIDANNPNIIFFGTGTGDNTNGSFYGTGVYESTNRGQTWALLTDPTLSNGPVPGDPIYGFAITQLVFDPASNVLYAATSDMATNNDLKSTGTVNQPTDHNVGVWRYNLNTDSWLNLTDITSSGRAAGTSILGNTAPNKPGPDDDFPVSFPEGANTAWTSLVLTGGNLYAALGTEGGSNINAVYFLTNPATANTGANPPTWYLGTSDSTSALPSSISVPQLDSEKGNFPLNVFTNFGNIKLASSGGSVYAAVTNSLVNPLDEILVTSNGGLTWTVTGSTGNYMANNGFDATAIGLVGGTVFVGGTDSGSANYVYELPGTNISVDANKNGPSSEVLAMAADGSNLLVGTAGGIWEYVLSSATWKDINGNLDDVEFNGIASNPTNPNIVYGAGEGISTSVYTGTQSWTEAPVTAGTGPGGLDAANTSSGLADLNGSSVAVDPNNANTVYAFEQGAPWAYNAALYVSKNGGATWAGTGVSTGIQTGAVVIDNLSRVFATTSGGLDVFNPTIGSWQNIGGNLTPTAIAVAELQGPYVADSRFSGISDLGATSPDSNTVYVTDGTKINLTKNFGNTWATAATIPDFASGNVINDVEVDPTDRDYVYAVIGGTIGLPDTGSVWLSTNAGQTWTNISTGLPTAPTISSLASISLTNAGNGYTKVPAVTIAPPSATITAASWSAGTATITAYNAFSAGQTVSITGMTPNAYNVTNVTITSATDTSFTFALAATTGVGTVFGTATTNAGASAVATISTSGYLTGITLTSAGAGYTSTPSVTIASPGGGTTAQATPLFSTVPAWKLVIDARYNQTGTNLYLATDRGVYEYTVNSAGVDTWVPFGSNMPQVPVHALSLNQSTNILTAGTFGRGAYQFYLDNPTTLSGAMYAGSGSVIWNGPIILAGPTTIGVSGNQALNNGVAVTQLTIQGQGLISDQTYAEAADAANTLTMVGNGNLVLDSASPDLYGGTTLVDGGNLIIQSATGLGAAGVTNTQQLSVTGVVSSFTLSFNGSAASVSIPYTGNAATDAAALQAALASLSTISPNAVTVTPNGTGVFLITSAAFAGSAPALQASVTGAGSVTSATVGTQELFVNGAVNNVSSLTFKFNGTGPSVSVTYTGNATVDAANIQAALAGLATIGANVTVTPDGTGVFLITAPTLTGTNLPMILPTVAGPGSAYAVAAGGTVVAAGSILQLQSSLNAEPLFLFGNGVVNEGHYSGALENVSGQNTYTGTITLETNSTIGVASPSTLTLTSPSPNTVYGITDLGGGASGEFSLTKEGTGTLVLASTDSYEGNTTVNQGVLSVQNNSALGVGGATTTVVDRAQLQLQGGVSVTNQNLVLSGSGIAGAGALVNVSGNNTWGSLGESVILTSAPAYGVQSTVTGNSTPTGTVAIGVTNPGDTLTIASVIGEAPAMMAGASLDGAGNTTAAATIAGAPALNAIPTPTGTGSNFGSSAVPAGTYYYVITAVVNGLESAPGNEHKVTVAAGQTVQLSWSPVANATSYNVYRSVVSASYPSPALVASGITATSYSDTGTAASSGTPPMTLASGLTKLGAGTLTLAQNNTYRGSTYVQAGTLNVQKSDALGLDNGDAIQRLTVVDPAGTDTFKLSFNGQTTGSIGFRATAATVANALNGLSSIGPGGVDVALNEVYSGLSTQETLTLTNPVSLTANPTSPTKITLTLGTLSQTISYTGVGGTGAGSDAATIQAALDAMAPAAASASGLDANGIAPFPSPSPYAGQVTVTPDATDTIFTVTYGGALQDQQNAPTFAAAVSSGPGAAVTQVTQQGAGQPTDVYTITFVGAPPTTSISLAGLAQPPIQVIVPTNAAETATVSPVAVGGVGTVVSSGATLQLDGSLGSISTIPLQTLSLNGAGVNGGGALRSLSGNDTWNGLVYLQTSSAIDAAPGSTLNIAGTIEDTTPALIPPATLTIGNSAADTGLVVFPNANTYTGSTQIDAGILNIQNPDSLGVNTSAEQTLTVNGTAGSFTLGFTDYPAGVTTGAINTPTLTTATLNTALTALMANASAPGGGTGTAVATANSSGNAWTITFGGSLVGQPVPLLAVQATQPNTSVGIVTLLNGGGSSTTVASGATLQLQTATETSLKPLTLNGAGLNNAGALENVSGSNTWGSSPITLGSTASISADGSSTLTISQPIVQSPVLNTPTLVSGGGTIPSATTYFYVVTAITANGETIPSNEVSITTTAANQAVQLTWAAYPTATGYNVYRSTASGVYTSPALLTTIGVATTTAFIDTGSTVSAGAAPASGAYGVNKIGTGTLVYSGAASNQYNGLTSVLAGELKLNKTSGALAVAGNLSVGDTGSQPTQTLTLSGYSSAGPDQFTLTFRGATTAAINYSGVAGTDAASIQAALALILPAGDTVSVTPTSTANQYLVSFGGGLAGTSPAAITYTDVAPATGTIAVVATGGVPGTPNTDIVQAQGNSEIDSAAAVTILDDGEYRLGTHTQTVAAINMTGGNIALGTGSDLTLTGNLTAISDGTGSATIGGPGTLTLTSATPTFTINQGAKSSDLVVNSVIAGSTGLIKNGAGRLEIGAVDGYGTTTDNAGDVQVDSGDSIGAVTLSGGSVSGTGTVASITSSSTATPAAPANTVNPGYNGSTPSTGILNVNGAVTWSSGTTFWVDLSSGSHPTPTAGADYDQLVVNGNVNLNNALLAGTVAANVQIGDTFTILQVTGGNTLSGELDTLVNNAPTATDSTGTNGFVFIGGKTFQIVITTGVNGSVVLTRAHDVVASFTITPAPSGGTSVYGQDVVYTAAIALEPGATLPTGTTIQFTLDASDAFTPYSGGANTVNVTLTGQTGTATYDPQTANSILWAVGTHTIDATFVDPSGDVLTASYAPTFQATAFQQTVTAANTTTASANVTTDVGATSVNLSATVTGNPPATSLNPPVNEGTVTFTLYNSLHVQVGSPVTSGTLSGGATGNVAYSLPANTPAGTYKIVAAYSDTGGNFQTSSDSTRTLIINPDMSIAPAPAALVGGDVGVLYSHVITVSNGTTPYTLSLNGTYSDPSNTGLTAPTINQSAGTLTFNNTPTGAGTVTFTLTATDAAGFTDPQTYTIVISPDMSISPTPATVPAGDVGVAYNHVLALANGTAPYTALTVASYNAGGTGLAAPTVNVSAGTITFNGSKPTAAGTVTFTVSATDTAGGTLATQSYSITINPALAVTPTPANLLGGDVSLPYSRTITVSGGTTPYNISSISGFTDNGTGLVAGDITANSAAGTITISGTPTGTGTATFMVTVSDAAGASLPETYTINVYPALAITPAASPATPSTAYALPAATYGMAYTSQTISLDNPLSSLTVTGFSVPGMTAVATVSTGKVVVSGTPTAVPAAFNFTVTGTDVAGATVSQLYSFTVNTAAVTVAAANAVADLQSSNQTVTLSAAVTSAAGVVSQGSVSFQILNASSVQVGSIVTYNVSSGTATGSYTLPGNTPTGTYTIVATYNPAASGADFSTNSDSTHTLTVSPDMTFTPGAPGTMPPGDVASLYNQVITVSGGSGSGTAYTTLKVTNYSDPSATGLASPTIVNAAGTHTITFNSTPTKAGTVTFTVTAIDTAGVTLTQNYTVVISPALAIAPTTLPAAEAGKLYNPVITVSGGSGSGTSPWYQTLSVSNYLDPSSTGLAAPTVVNTTAAHTVTFSNTPTKAGTVSFTVNVKDAAGVTLSQNYTVTVDPALAITPAATPATPTVAYALPAATYGSAYSTQTLSLNNPLTALTVTGFSVPGMTAVASVAAGTVVISGTPTAVPAAFNFTVAATDNAGATLSQIYSFTVNKAAVTVNAVSRSVDFQTTTQIVALSAAVTSAAGVVNQGSVSFEIENASNVQVGSIVTFTVSSGAAAGNYTLPANSPAGAYKIVATYIPAASGTDFLASSDSTHTLTVNADMTITPTAMPGADVNAPYSASVALANGTAPYTLSLGSPSTFNAGTTGLAAPIISGGTLSFNSTPTGTGTVSFTVSATDAAGATLTKNYTITVNPALVIAPTTLSVAEAGHMYNPVITVSGGSGSGATPWFPTFNVSAYSDPSSTGLAAPTVVNTAAAHTVTFSSTPTKAGTVTFTVNVKDSAGVTLSQNYSVTVEPALAITPATATLPAATYQTSYSQTISLNDPLTSLTVTGFSVPGMSAVANVAGGTVVISGTPTSVPAPFSFTVKATDAAGATLTQTYTFTVNKAAVTVTAANQSVNFETTAQPVTLSAAVTSSAGTVSEGTVTFAVYTTPAHTVQVGSAVTSATVSNGVASATYTLPAGYTAGTYSIVATYNSAASGAHFLGNTNSAQSPTPTLTVNKATATVAAVNTTAAYSTVSHAVTLTAKVTSPAGIVNEGTVTFKIMNGATLIGTATTSGTIISGAASVAYTLPAEAVGSNFTIVATYNPGADYLTATDSSHTLGVRYAVNLALATSANPVTAGNSVTYTATLTSPTGTISSVAGETVTFTNTSTGAVIGTGTLNSSGVATLTTSFASAGTYAISAAFADDGTFASATASLTQTVSSKQVVLR